MIINCMFLFSILLFLSIDSYAQNNDKGSFETNKAEKFIIEGNYSSAVPLLQKAEELGNKKAKFLLGRMYFLGAGGLPRREGYGWAKIANAADHGCEEALIWLLELFTTDKDELLLTDELQSYIDKLIAKNNPQGYYYGGLFCIYGSNNKDERKGVSYLTKAAELGDADAEYELAMCCINDLGDAGNYEDALKWLERSRKHGNDNATQYLIFNCN